METQTNTAPEGGQIHSGDVIGLAEAAKELVEIRQGNPEQHTENPSLPTDTEHEPSDELKLDASESDDMSIRTAGQKLAELRMEREEARRLFAGEPPPGSSPDEHEIPAEPETEADKQLAAERLRESNIRAEQEREREAAAHRYREAALRAHEVAQQSANTVQAQFQAAANSLNQHLQTLYPEHGDTSAVQRMAQQDPSRFASYQQDYGNAERGLAILADNMVRAAERDQIVAAQQQVQAFQAQATDWDRQFESQHRHELANKEYARTVAQECLNALKESGVSEQDIQQGYYYGVGPCAQLRTPLGQEAIWAMGKQRVAQKGLVNHRAKNLRPVQKPGVASDRPPGRADLAVKNASDALCEKPSVRNAARLLAARRRSQ